ncbi:hypothetical protein Efla_003745 [Eimeria flavescens]
MKDSGEPSTEAPGDSGSCWMRRRMREQRSQQHDDGQDLHSLTDERARALLEYRARCTSARFWIQSELLDLHVGCVDQKDGDGTSRQQHSPAGSVASSGENINGSDPGVVGDLPSLMRRHLTCPLLSKLLQQDPVLSGKLAMLDHVLWHRRSKHEPQTSGWMSHDPQCPDGCAFGVSGVSQGTTEAPAPADLTNASSVASSRSSTMESAAGGEVSAGLSVSSTDPPSEPQQTGTVEEESRPYTVWVSCERCMEHFAYIAASLLVFLKPSELRDLAVERQQSNCCGFVFCGRRNVATPEKRRAALWRWTLDFGGSKALTEDELVQFCCSRCCNRQQQLLRLLDEEPMYARPGIKEWIGDALQRKAAHRPHPHGVPEEAGAGEAASSSQTEERGVASGQRPTAAASRLKKEARQADGPRPPVEMDVLLKEGAERLEAERLVGPLLEKPPSCVSFSTESSSGELARVQDAQLADGFRVPLTVEDDESSADEASASPARLDVESGLSAAVGKDDESSRVLVMSKDRQRSKTTNNSFLMLNYGVGEAPGVQNTASPPSSCSVTAEAHPSGVATGATAPAKAGDSSPLPSKPSSASGSLASASFVKSDETGKTPSKQQPQQPSKQQQQQEQQPSASTDCPTDPPSRSRGSRVRFADDDAEDAEDGDGDGDNGSASLFQHFFNMHDEDDGPGFYHRADRSGSAGSGGGGGQARNGTGELRSILKPATEPVTPSPSDSAAASESQVGYMRLSDVVIAFDLLSSCCTDASSAYLAGYHRRFCTCTCEGAVRTGASASDPQTDAEESPKLSAGSGEGGGRGLHSRDDSEADESDRVSCLDGESGDEIEPADLWRRRQQQLIKAILRSLPPSADSFAPLVTELCETFQPLQPLPTLRCSLCSCLAAVILLLLLLLRARPLTCCCCCESCRPWSNSHERHSRCQRRQPTSDVLGKAGAGDAEDAGASFYFDDALTLAKEEDVGLALVDFVRSTIHQSAPSTNPHRPVLGGVDASSAADTAETPAHHHEERAVHVLLESIFARMTRPIVQMCGPLPPPH